MSLPLTESHPTVRRAEELLPNELWGHILSYNTNPQTLLVCQLFKAINSDAIFILGAILPDLKKRGITPCSSKETKVVITWLMKIKLQLAAKLYFMDPCESRELKYSSLSAPTLMKAFQEEEAIALNAVSLKLYTTDVITIVDGFFKNRLPQRRQLKAALIRHILVEQNDKLTAITELDRRSLNLTMIPKELSLFSKLINVDLSDNRLSELPDDFGATWTDLKYCTLDYNNIRSLPHNFGASWSRLHTFSIEKNKLQHLDDSFGEKWTSLVVLNLNSNKLSSLPNNFGSYWPRVESIYLGGDNRFKDIPKAIGNYWPNLRNLVLSISS